MNKARLTPAATIASYQYWYTGSVMPLKSTSMAMNAVK